MNDKIALLTPHPNSLFDGACTARERGFDPGVLTLD